MGDESPYTFPTLMGMRDELALIAQDLGKLQKLTGGAAVLHARAVVFASLMRDFVSLTQPELHLHSGTKRIEALKELVPLAAELAIETVRDQLSRDLKV